MTWIGGIFSKGNMSPGDLRRKMALTMETGCPEDKLPIDAYPRYESLIIDEVHSQALARVSRVAQGVPGEPAYAGGRGKLTLIYDGQVYDCRGTSSRRSRGPCGSNTTAIESFVRLVGELPGNLEQKVRGALTGLDGDYALAVTDAGHMLISRDPLGTKPLYFAENSSFSAFASNKKPLWKIGLDEVRPLRAGMLAVFDRKEIKIDEGLPLKEKEITVTTMAQAVSAYQRAMESAVEKRLPRTSHVPKVGVLLSGGVDSCLIAKLVRDAASALGIETIAYTAGLRNSPDVESARDFAKGLDITHRVKALSAGDVERYIPRVIHAIEDSDFVQVETGIGLCAAVDMARQDGLAALFSGQGPDELWGGYNWYPKVLAKDGRRELCRRMWEDFTRADIETLDRENKVALANDVELIFPYLDINVVNVALSVASELKVTSGEDYLGKHPHRRLAMKLGISERFANREKLAIQHGTGIHGVLDSIARKNGFDPALVENIGYESEEITAEKLGSSSRYGYRYIAKELWQVPQHVQFFFHTLAYRQGLLDRSVRDRVGYFLEKAGLPVQS
jgi:asparagine synthase (glutamine-hydrolysing)